MTLKPAVKYSSIENFYTLPRSSRHLDHPDTMVISGHFICCGVWICVYNDNSRAYNCIHGYIRVWDSSLSSVLQIKILKIILVSCYIQWKMYANSLNIPTYGEPGASLLRNSHSSPNSTLSFSRLSQNITTSSSAILKVFSMWVCMVSEFLFNPNIYLVNFIMSLY